MHTPGVYKKYIIIWCFVVNNLFGFQFCLAQIESGRDMYLQVETRILNTDFCIWFARYTLFQKPTFQNASGQLT